MAYLVNTPILYPPLNSLPNYAAVVLTPAVATTTLSDPGPLCAGQTAVLTCSVADGVSIEWFYRDVAIGPFISPAVPPSSNPVTVGGVQFTRTLSQNSNSLTSQLSFTASPDMDGSVVRCLGESPSDAFSDVEITLQVEMICKSIDCSENNHVKPNATIFVKKVCLHSTTPSQPSPSSVSPSEIRSPTHRKSNVPSKQEFSQQTGFKAIQRPMLAEDLGMNFGKCLLPFENADP